MHDLVIQSHRGPYRVHFGAAFEGLERGLSDQEHLIIDARVAELYAQPLAQALLGPSVLVIEATETNKALERLPAYVKHLLDRGVKRGHTLIAVGGGIIQDITAFMAAILLRGISWRFYPTTLLAQADSCIGSKSSLNVGGYKNQLGTFTPPQDIVISLDVLDTLSQADLRSGIGEMLKVHIIAGWDDFQAITRDYPRLLSDRGVLLQYLQRSLEIKKALIEKDEFDRQDRLVMNYGHTFGHAMESATDYRIPHGIAVTIGMDMANYVSRALGLIQTQVYQELHRPLAANYTGFEQYEIPETRFFEALVKDKKHRDQDLSLILLRGPGQVFLQRHPNNLRFQDLCREYLALLSQGAVTLAGAGHD